MQVRNPTRLTTVLLASTVMATTLVLPEAAYGSQQARMEAIKRKQEEALAKERLALGGVHGAAIGDITKHKNALADPNAALTAAGAGTLTQAITDAKADGASAANPLPIGTVAEKIAALKAIEAIPSPGAEDNYKRDIRIALGLKSDAASLVNAPIASPETTAVIQFRDAANRQEKTPGRKAAIAGHGVAIANVTKHKDALADPNAALTAAGAGTLTQAITDAKADGASAANPLPIGTVAEKIAALKAIEAIPSPGAEDNYKRDIRIALGLKSDAASLVNAPIASPETTAVIQFRDAANRQEKTPGRKAAIAGHAAAIADIRKHKAALADLTATLTTPAAPGNMMQAITDAIAVGASAAHALPIGTPAEKIAVLEAIDGASGAGTDDVANSAVRTALGLDPTVGNFAATKAEVTRFIKLAKTEAVKTPARKATIVDLQKYATAIANPHGALVGGQPLDLALAAAGAINPSASHGMPLGTPVEKAKALRAIEVAVLHHGGGGGIIANDNAKAAIRTALGIDPTPAQFVATQNQILAFLVVAEEPEIHNTMLAGIGGAVPTIDKIESIRTRLNAAVHRGDNGAGVPAGGAADTIAASLARLGL